MSYISWMEKMSDNYAEKSHFGASWSDDWSYAYKVTRDFVILLQIIKVIRD